MALGKCQFLKSDRRNLSTKMVSEDSSGKIVNLRLQCSRRKMSIEMLCINLTISKMLGKDMKYENKNEMDII